MTPLQIKTAMKIHHQAVEKPEDYDILAQELDLNISDEAEEIL